MGLPLDGRRYSIRVTYNDDHKALPLAGHQTVLATIYRAVLAYGLTPCFTFASHGGFLLRRNARPGEPGETLNPSSLLCETICAEDTLTLVRVEAEQPR